MKYIYLIQNQEDNGWFKCGETTRPKQRLRAFQNFSPKELEYHALYPCPDGISDRDCHKALAHFNSVREWFEGDIDEASNIIKDMLDVSQVQPQHVEPVNVVRRQPKTKRADRSAYGSASFLDVVCPV